MAQGYTKDQPLDTDVNLGGGSPSDYIAASQKATKTYVDNKLSTQDIVKVSQLVASDGSPDPAWATDATGNLSAQGTYYLATDTINEFTAAAGVTIDSVLLKDQVVNGYFDNPLIDSGDASGIATHLLSDPSWTAADSALISSFTQWKSFWSLADQNAGSWKYRKQTNINIESLSASAYAAFAFYPIYFRNGIYTQDLHYIIGMYGDNAGAINEQKYSRVDLYWNQASAVWQVRGEAKDGTTATTSTYISLASIPVQPISIRVLVQNATNKPTRQYVGVGPQIWTIQYPADTLLQAVNKNTTWGQVWLQIEMNRGTGVNDAIHIGAIDYLAQFA